MESRKKTGRLTVRCSEQEARQIKELGIQQGLTLTDLLIKPILTKPSMTGTNFPLNTISNYCVDIENSLHNEQDKEIFRRGMEKIWDELLKI